MKRFGNAVRLTAILCVSLLMVVALAGCGDDKESSSENSTKTYSQNETLGEAGKVVVKSDQEFNAEQQAVINRIAEFGDATQDKDFKKICDEYLTEKAAKLGGDCEAALKKSGDDIKEFKITVTSVKIGADGKTATADTITDVNGQSGSTQPLSLAKDESGEWRVTILGE